MAQPFPYQVGVPGGEVAPLVNVRQSSILGEQVARSTSDIAQTVAQAGQQYQETQSVEKRLQLQQQRLQAQQKLNFMQASATLDLHQAAQDALQGPDPEKAVDTFRAALPGLRQKWADQTSEDPGLGQELSNRMALAAREKMLSLQETTFKVGQQSAVGKLGNTLDMLAQAGSMATSQAELTRITAQADHSIDTLVAAGALRPDQAEAKKRDYRATQADITARQMIQGDPAMAAKVLADPRYFGDLPPDRRQTLAEHAQVQMRVQADAAQADANRAIALQERAKRQASDNAENAIIQDVFSANPQITAQDVAKNGNLTPDARLRMIGVINRADKPDPLARVSQETTMQLLSDMRRPEGDPRRVSDMQPIYDQFIAGKLSRPDFGFLRDELTQRQSSPDGQRFSDRLGEFLKAVKPAIDKSNPMMGNTDPLGAQKFYTLQQDLNAKIEQYRKAGKDPADLLNPASPDYMGKPAALQPYMTSIQESQDYMTQQLTRGQQQTATPPEEPGFFSRLFGGGSQPATPPPLPVFTGPDDPAYKRADSGTPFVDPAGNHWTKP